MSVSVFAVSADALIVNVSPAPLAVIEVAAEPVVIAMALSTASPVVTVSAPVKEPAAIFPIRPVTVSAAEPDQRQRGVLGECSSIDRHHIACPARRDRGRPDPVVIEIPLSAALPVVTVSAPIKEPAAISPTRPVTVSAAEPANVRSYSVPVPSRSPSPYRWRSYR